MKYFKMTYFKWHISNNIMLLSRKIGRFWARITHDPLTFRQQNFIQLTRRFKQYAWCNGIVTARFEPDF